MILWTIQTLEAWAAAEREGRLVCYPEYAEPRYRYAYDWMEQQMEAKIGPRPESGLRPVWAWLQWCCARHRKPDLRHSSHLQAGRRGVRVRFSADETEALLSDFSSWHNVLNGMYLATSKADDDAFDRDVENLHVSDVAKTSRAHIDRRIKRSWERIFDIDHYEPDWSDPRDEKSIQATLWQVPMTAVLDVQQFLAR